MLNFYLVLLAVLGLTLILFYLLWIKVKALMTLNERQANELRLLSQQQTLLQQALSESRQSEIGLGKKLTQLEQKLAQLRQQVDEIELLEPQSKLYNRANKLAQKGASLNEIIEECEISRAEAELIIALTQKK